MRTIFLCSYDFEHPLASLQLKHFLEHRFGNAKVILVVFDHDLSSEITSTTDSWSMKILRSIPRFMKRMARMTLTWPSVRTVNAKSFRKAVKDVGECIFVAPWFGKSDLLVNRCSELLHDCGMRGQLYISGPNGELSKTDWSKPTLPYLEYHVSWNCNLKCKGCGHHSNLYNVPRMGNLSSYVADMERLSELFRGINCIHLLGGEPLMNRELPSFIIETRRIFSNSTIQVVTNGLLIPKTNEDVFDAMRNADAMFMITCYPPTDAAREDITSILKHENIKYFFSPVIKKFLRHKHRQQYFDPNESFRKCFNKHWHFLHDGKLSVCPTPTILEQSKDFLPVDYRVSDADFIDIYDPSIKSGYDILDRLHCSIPFCRYCDSAQESYKWEGNYTEWFDFR